MEKKPSRSFLNEYYLLALFLYSVIYVHMQISLNISLVSQYAVEKAISRFEGKHFPLITTEKFLCCLETK